MSRPDVLTDRPANIVVVKPRVAIPTLKTAVKLQIPTLLWGMPGIGKSSFNKQIASDLSLKLKDGLRASILDPVDIHGLPMIDPVAMVTKWARAEFLPTEADGPCLLFIDEITYATAAVQATLMMLTLERRVGEYRLPADCAVLAATNLEGMAGTHRLLPALANRFTHIEVEADFEDWREWAWDNRIHPVVIAFLTNHQQYFFKYVKEDRAYPTPRAWETVSKLIYEDAPSTITNTLITGTVGNEAGTMCAGFIPVWRATAGLIDNILNDPMGAAIPPEAEQNLRVMITMGLAGAMNDKNVSTILTYLERMGSREYAAWAMQGGSRMDKRIIHTDAYSRWSAKHHRAIADAA